MGSTNRPKKATAPLGKISLTATTRKAGTRGDDGSDGDTDFDRPVVSEEVVGRALDLRMREEEDPTDPGVNVPTETDDEKKS